MAITLVAAAATVTNGSATVPTGVQDNDVCLVACYKQSTGASSATGFTQVFTRDLSSSNLTVLAKAASGEGASWTITGSTAAVSIAFRGAKVPTSWNAVSAAAAGTGTLTNGFATSALLDVFSTWATTGTPSAHTTPTNYTAPANNTLAETHAAGNMKLSVFYRLLSPAGANSVTNAPTSTVNGSGLIEIPEADSSTASRYMFQHAVRRAAYF